MADDNKPTTPRTVTVWNLTDVTGKALTQRKMQSKSIEVAGQLCEPGGSVSIAQTDWHSAKARYKHLFALGALFEGAQPPPNYLKDKAAAADAAAQKAAQNQVPPPIPQGQVQQAAEQAAAEK